MTSVILQDVKYPHNLAAAIRACACFGVDQLLWTGERFSFTEGERLPREERMKGYSDVKVLATERPFDHVDRVSADQRTSRSVKVCVELMPTSAPLTRFTHPEHATYVLGPEDGYVNQAFRGLCHVFVYIPSYHCLNLAAALNVVLAHRMMQQQLVGKLPCGSASELLKETRGEIAVPGWEGK